jgi:hypothetical protein
MSADNLALLHQQLVAGEMEAAENTARGLQSVRGLAFAELARAIQHAINARQPAVVLLLLADTERFCAAGDAPALLDRLEALVSLIAACRREKLEEPARRASDLALELLTIAEFPQSIEALGVVARFAGSAGSYALRRRDLDWFSPLALQTAGWASRCENCQLDDYFLPVLEIWMHRATRHKLLEAVPIIFEAVHLLVMAAADRGAFLQRFLPEWRIAAATASLNPENPQASVWVEQLLLWTIRSEDKTFWRPVMQRIAEVAGLAVSRHGVTACFCVFRPLLDVGRVQLADELKFGSGPDETSSRQMLLRMVCNEALRIAEMAAHKDFSAVAGDKIEEMYHSWLSDPDYESQTRSIERFCQLMLIFWSQNKKRAARKWTPRDERLATPLLSEEERQKLSFLL